MKTIKSKNVIHKYTFNTLLLVLILHTSCSFPNIKSVPVSTHNTLFLKSTLNEISGLEYVDSNTLIAIHDESGIIYYINSKSGEINGSDQFSKRGDFEGIAKDDNIVYALRSDGTIYKYDGEKKSKCSFDSKKLFDFEGLCLNKKTYKLYVACKKHGKKDKQDKIWVYQIDLKKFKFEKEPKFKLNKKEYQISKNFQPSGIAIDTSENVVILSSYSHEILVISPEGKFVKSTALNKSIFAQPEGITIAPNGVLYISNEKKTNGPNILIFDSLESLLK